MRLRMLSFLSVSVIASLTLLSFGQVADVVADDDEKKPSESETDRWMAIKLTSSQQILEYLTRGEFEQLEKTTRRMQVMNVLEQWRRKENFADQSAYQGQLNAFEFATKELVRHAKDENTEGALKAYHAMTDSCVRCHMLIRDSDD